jgi:hypothetical protein
MTQTIHFIDPEFRDLLPKPSVESLAELEQSLLSEGPREPLVAWRHDGKLILLDGHNRYSICEAHGLKCKVLVKTDEEIPDRDAAINWILRNQLARRNLTADQFALYLGKLYNVEKPKQGGTGANQHGAQTGHSVRSARQLAQEHGVSEKTVRRAGEFAEAVEKVKKADPDIEAKVVKGEVTRQEVVEKAKPTAKTEPKDRPQDVDGREIPEHLIGVFAAQEQFRDFTQDLSTLKGKVTQAVSVNPVAWSRFNNSAFGAAIEKARDLLTLSGPYIVCSYCGASESERCQACKGAGFLTKAQARCVPKEMRSCN